MGWAIGYDGAHDRDIGYGVPAWCDHPDCTEKIDRGLAYVCGGEPYGGDRGCGLHFCSGHLFDQIDADGMDQVCERCVDLDDDGQVVGQSFPAKPDHPEWIAWKLSDESWAQWRSENPQWVAENSTNLVFDIPTDG
jgi:hypothetical protein